MTPPNSQTPPPEPPEPYTPSKTPPPGAPSPKPDQTAHPATPHLTRSPHNTDPFDRAAYRYGASLPSAHRPTPPEDPTELAGRSDPSSPLTRRRFMQGLAATSVAGAGIFAFSRNDNDPTKPEQQGGAAKPAPDTNLAGQAPDVAPTDERVLVLLELEGGNDGLSTVVPRNVGAYYDLRPNMAIAEEELLDFDDELGLNPKLATLTKQRLMVVEGVGPVNGNLSHFDMVQRWETGDIGGDTSQRSGFLARLSDSLQSSSPLVGLSVSGHTPRFNGAAGAVLSIDEPNQLKTLINDDWIFPSYRNALKSFSGEGFHADMAESWSNLFSIGDSLNIDLDAFDDDDPMVAEGGSLGRQLLSAAELIKADVGVRVIHVRLGGFDTHDGHEYKHSELMGYIDVAVGGFLKRMEDAGLANRVLVATTSEFGRRLEENRDGFDHGAASTMLLSGPIKAGRIGERPPLDDLDEDGNLKTTMAFDRYLATLAQSWLGVEAASILPNDPQPFDLF